MITYNNNLKIFIVLLTCKTINCFIDPTLDTTKNQNDYIDPHSIYYNKYTQQLQVRTEIKTPNTPNKCNECHINSIIEKKDIPDQLFSRKFVNLLLAAASFEENDNLLTSIITIELTKKELKQLKEFGLGKLTLREIDPVFVNIFKEPEKSFTRTISTFIKDLIFNAIIYKEITLIIIVVLYILWIILTIKWNILKLMLIILLSIFAASFIITWLQLVREAEIKLTVKQVQYAELPIQCNPNKMSWWNKLWASMSSENECKKYYEAMMENPFLQVTPAQALSQMIFTCILTPISKIGSAFGDFINNSTKHLFFPIRMIVAPLLIIGIIMITVIILIILFGGSLFWGFGPFSVFSLRGSTDSRNNRNLPSTNRQPIQPIYNFNLHEGHIHEITIKNTDENSTSVDVKTTPVPILPTKSIQLDNKGPDVKINVIESSTSLQSLKFNEESIIKEDTENKAEKSSSDKVNGINENKECTCQKKSNPVSESGDS